MPTSVPIRADSVIPILAGAAQGLSPLPSLRPSLRPRACAEKKQELLGILSDYQLPSFPVVVAQALQKLRDPDASLMQVADRIAADPAVSAQLLRVTNSAAFSLRHRIESVEHAVSLLGRTEVEALLIAAVARGALPQRPRPGFAPIRFWKAAGRRAAAARALASVLHPETRSESFTAALLQDMALPVLSEIMRRSYGALAMKSYVSGIDLAQLELNELGWTHADAAGWMCQRWSFPKRITMAIERHHYTDLGAIGVLPAVSLVSLLRESEALNGNEELIESVHAAVGVPKDFVVNLVKESIASSEEVARLFVVR